MGLDYKAFELKLLAAIHIRFGLPPETPKKTLTYLKKCDFISAYLEATQLAGFSVEESERFFGKPKGLEGPEASRFFTLKPLAPNDASALYLRHFRTLTENA